MRLRNATAEIYAPDGADAREALARTTHMAVVAHQDDVEILAVDGVLACYDAPDLWLAAVVATDGGGSPRTGPYAETTDDEMRALRRDEQKAAARLGRYGAVVFLDYASDAVRGVAEDVVDDLAALFDAAAPGVVYTHNLADRHDTHVAVALRTIEALRRGAPARRPERVLGCEVWRDLDWLAAADKVLLDVSARPDLQTALVSAFESQTVGGKRYDLAALGRRRAHATFLDPYAADVYEGVTLAMDLTPLVADPRRPVADYVDEIVDRFRSGVRGAIEALA
jgi:LmbE family N-acetylglucosaminyl deacetylase